MVDTVIQQRIRQRLEEVGLSANAASKKATGNPDAIRYILRGHKPSFDRLAEIARVLDTTPEWLSGEDSDLIHAGVRDRAREFFPERLPMNLPVLGTALGCDLDFNGGNVPVEAHQVDMGETVRFIRRPASLDKSRNAYSLYIAGESMAPRFEPSELIYVDPQRHPAIGDYVVVQLVGDDGHEVVTALIKRLVRRTSSYVELEQLRPERRFQVPVIRIHAIHRVVPWGELLGS